MGFSDSGLGFRVWGCSERINGFWEGLETSRNRKENEHLERYWRVRFLGYGSVIEDWCLFPTLVLSRYQVPCTCRASVVAYPPIL